MVLRPAIEEYGMLDLRKPLQCCSLVYATNKAVPYQVRTILAKQLGIIGAPTLEMALK